MEILGGGEVVFVINKFKAPFGSWASSASQFFGPWSEPVYKNAFPKHRFLFLAMGSLIYSSACIYAFLKAILALHSGPRDTGPPR